MHPSSRQESTPPTPGRDPAPTRLRTLRVPNQHDRIRHLQHALTVEALGRLRVGHGQDNRLPQRDLDHCAELHHGRGLLSRWPNRFHDPHRRRLEVRDARHCRRAHRHRESICVAVRRLPGGQSQQLRRQAQRWP